MLTRLSLPHRYYPVPAAFTYAWRWRCADRAALFAGLWTWAGGAAARGAAECSAAAHAVLSFYRYSPIPATCADGLLSVPSFSTPNMVTGDHTMLAVLVQPAFVNSDSPSRASVTDRVERLLFCGVCVITFLFHILVPWFFMRVVCRTVDGIHFTYGAYVHRLPDEHCVTAVRCFTDVKAVARFVPHLRIPVLRVPYSLDAPADRRFRRRSPAGLLRLVYTAHCGARGVTPSALSVGSVTRFALNGFVLLDVT